MRVRVSGILAFLLCLVGVFPVTSFGQERDEGNHPRFGAGAKVSTLGIGIEAATAVTARSNVRGGVNFFSYSKSSDEDGINYLANLTLRSVQVTYDQYIIGGFHVSPGLLAYNGNRATATASVSAGQSFSLGDVKYFSSPANPIHGGATLKLGKAAPMLLLGFGNLVPRSRRHFAVNFDAGVIFQGSPDFKLSFAGAACTVNATTNCLNAATDPTVQSNVQREQDKTSNDLKGFKYYPVLSLGFGWKF